MRHQQKRIIEALVDHPSGLACEIVLQTVCDAGYLRRNVLNAIRRLEMAGVLRVDSVERRNETASALVRLVRPAGRVAHSV